MSCVNFHYYRIVTKSLFRFNDKTRFTDIQYARVCVCVCSLSPETWTIYSCVSYLIETVPLTTGVGVYIFVTWLFPMFEILVQLVQSHESELSSWEVTFGQTCTWFLWWTLMSVLAWYRVRHFLHNHIHINVKVSTGLYRISPLCHVHSCHS